MQNGDKFPVTIQQMLEKFSSTAAVENSDRLGNAAERYENHHPIQTMRAFDADEFCVTDELQESAEECDRLERIAESCEEEYRAKDEVISLAETADEEYYDRLGQMAEGYENCHPVQALRPFNVDELRAMDGPQESEECKRMDQVAQKYEEQHSKNVASPKCHLNLSAGELPKNQVFHRALDIIRQHSLCDILPEGSDGIVWRYNGLFYEPLDRNAVRQLIYNDLDKQEKVGHERIENYLKAISDYVFREVASRKKETGKYCFSNADFSKIQNHIVFQNGVYDVTTGKLLPLSDRLPYYMGVKANFTADYCQSPSFEKLKTYGLDNNDESMNMLDIITAAMFLNQQIKHIFVAGSASNSGKSKYIEFLERLMPEGRVCRLDPADLNGKFALGNADIVTLFSCADIEMNVISTRTASKLKQMTGDTFIRGEAKHQQARDIRILGKVILGTNGRFATQKLDQGLFNRLIVLPFVREVEAEHRDPDLLDKLWEDRDDIMSMCAIKLHELMAEKGQLVIPESELSRQIKDKWNVHYDFVQEFMDEKILISGDNTDNIDKKTLYMAYSEFFNECAFKSGMEYCSKLSQRELIDRLYDLSGGRIERGRVTHVDGKKVPNAVWRICGLQLVDKKL